MGSLDFRTTVGAVAGAGLLGLGLLALPLLLRQTGSPAAQLPVSAASAVACTPGSPPVTVQNLVPSSAGTTSPPGSAAVNAQLYGTSALHLIACRAGTLRLNVRGVGGGGWGAQIALMVNGQTRQTANIDGPRTVEVSLPQPSLVTLAFVNDARAAVSRYLTVTRDPRGPWCAEKPPYREGGAWLRPGGEYGDITGGGRLNFPTCGAGQVMFRVTGQAAKGSAPQMQISQDGRIVETREVTDPALLTFTVARPTTLTFTVLNPELKVNYDRSVYLDQASLEPF